MFASKLHKYSITLQTLLCSTIVFSFFSWSFYPLGAHFWSFLLLSSIYIQVEAELFEYLKSEDRSSWAPVLRGIWMIFSQWNRLCLPWKDKSNLEAEMSRVRQEGHSLPSQGTSETGLLGGAKTRWSREHLGGVVGNMARGSV